MRVLVLLTDAFGGNGGIALYNRDVLTALCTHQDCTEVVAIPRLMPNSAELLPEKLTYITDGVGSKWQYVRTVLKVAKQHKPFDLIICGHINLLLIACFLRTWIKTSILLEIYGIDAWKPTKSRLINHLVSYVDVVVSISNITRNRFLDWSNLDKGRIFLLPNAIHIENYGISPKNYTLVSRYALDDKVVLMTLGRMSASEQYKGFDEMLEILPDLANTIPNVVYLVVGDGDDRQRLEAKAKELGVIDRVIFTGYVDEGEKADYYRLSDVYIMPSSGEGFGFVLLEAMACGIPVVASKVDGSREAVHDGKLGIIVDPNDAHEIKEGIMRALAMPRSLPAGLEYFSFENFTLRLHRILDSVIQKECNT